MTVVYEEMSGLPEHGGDLGGARRLFPEAPEPWIDLSTGISPHSYPYRPLAATAFSRLPEEVDLRRLKETAARAYGAISEDHVAAAPGTQSLLPLVMSLVPRGRVAVLSPTYSEHARAAALVGHEVTETADWPALFDADLAVVVNPNNPDGRVVERNRLLDLARSLAARSGLLVVDEAFMDVARHDDSIANMAGEGGIVVLRSFGKFYGLAGLRLGFAIGHPVVVRRLESRLGPWAVSGPAIAIGLEALNDRGWREVMRRQLTAEAQRLDRILAQAGLDVRGGTALFRYVETPHAGALFQHLGRQGILVRSFVQRPHALRIGLPGEPTAWQRLAGALTEWRARTIVNRGEQSA